MKRLLYILPVLILLTFTRCSEDFLEIKDPNSLTKEAFFNKVSDVNDELTTLYSNLHSISLFGKRYMPKGVGCLDHTFNNSHISSDEWNQYFQNNVNPTNSILEDTYRDVYKGIGIANDCLDNAEKLAQKVVLSASDQHQLNLIVAQAKFIRAFHYFIAINYWGRRPAEGGYEPVIEGVPLVTKPLTTLEETNIPVSPTSDVYALIFKDLKEAADSLPVTWNQDNIARITKLSALSLLGKAYLFTKDYTNASQYLKQVIDNGAKSLVPWEAYTKMFNDQTGTLQFNQESIFEVALKNNPASDWGSWNNSGGNMYSMVAGYWTFGADDNPLKAGQTGWNNVFVHDSNLIDFGFRLAPPKTPQELQSPEYIQKMKDALIGTDPRTRVNFLIPMLDTMKWDNGQRPIVARYGVENTGTYNWMPEDVHAWSIKKFQTINGSVYDYKVSTSENFIVIRLADVYLMYAEAQLGLGNEAEARVYINKIIERAWGDNLHNISSSGAQLWADLKHQRNLELFGEGHRWWDIVRWGDGEEMAAKFNRSRSGKINFTAPRSYFLPFPDDELKTNNKLKQHPEYQ